jgi:tape measure domain-containing protein
MATLRELVTKLTFKVDRAALKLAEKLMDNVGKSAEEVAKKTEKAERAMRNIGNVAKGVGLALTGAFVGAGIAVATAGIGLLKFNDRVKTTIAQIGILGGDMGQATNRFKEILAISQRTGQGFDEIAKLYGKVSMAAQDLNVNNKQVMQGLEVIAQAGVLSGTDAGSRNGALLQLGQAFGSAVVQAEEYNSVMDGLPKLHQEIARSMGMSAAQLSRFIKDTKKTGGITGKQLFGAVLAAAERMNSDFSKMPLTVDRIMNKIEVLKMTLGMDLEKEFKIPDAFLQELDGAVDRMAAFVRANKDLIGLGIKAVFEGMSFALKAVEAAIVFVVDAFKIGKVFVEAFASSFGGVNEMLKNSGFNYLVGLIGDVFIPLLKAALIVLGSVVFVVGNVLFSAIASVLNTMKNLDNVFQSSAPLWKKLLEALLSPLKMIWGTFQNIVNSANALTNAFRAISGMKMPAMPSIPISAGGATATPPSGRAPASKGAGSGAGSKSFTNTANTTVNINGGGITPSRARQLGAGFSAGSLSGFRALEVHGV